MPDDTAHTTALAPAAPAREFQAVADDSSFANLLDTARFEHMWRVAKVFAASGMVPKQYADNPAGCFVAVQMAVRLEVDPFMFMQNTYMSPDGKPAMYGQLAIALVNQRGPFTGPIQFTLSGQGDGRQCVAWGVDKRSGERCEVSVSIATAKAEGWYNRNPKWRNIPDMMLRYRAGAWLGRVYAPECLMGLPTSEEIEDIGETQRFERARDVTPAAPPRPRRADFADPAEQRFQAAVESGEFTGDVASEVAAETVDPETGEVTEGEPVDNSAENSGSVAEGTSQPADDEFWSRESYEIAPRKKGNTYQWREWEAEMLGRARTLPGLMAGGKLRAHAVKWLKASAQWNPGHTAFVAEFDRLTVPVVEGEG